VTGTGIAIINGVPHLILRGHDVTLLVGVTLACVVVLAVLWREVMR
jgi:inner membrane protein involved in colicin E2 resistance